MQPGATRTRFVRAATPASSVTASIRGLAKRLSPTQTVSKNPLSSANPASSSISAGVVTSNSTPRFGSVSPNFISFLCKLRRPEPTLGRVDLAENQPHRLGDRDLVADRGLAQPPVGPDRRQEDVEGERQVGGVAVREDP